MNLEAAGIEAQIAGEDAGGMAPHFSLFQGGFRVMVRTGDLSSAVEILKRGEHQEEEVEDKNKDAASKSRGFLAKLRKWIKGE